MIRIGSFTKEMAPIIIMVKVIVTYLTYIFAMMSVPHIISTIANKKRKMLGYGNPRLANSSRKEGTNSFTTPLVIKTYPITKRTH